MTGHGERPLAGPLASTNAPRNPAFGAQPAPVGDATDPPLPVSSVRLSHRGLVELAAQLSDRDRELLETLERLRLLQSDQVRRLFFAQIATEAASARVSRRALQRLCELRLVHRLERRVGGVRAGSRGTVYTSTARGRRLIAYWNGKGAASDRGVHEPGAAFVAHQLAVSELYVTLVETHRAGTIELLAFEGEPQCWRTFTGPLGGPRIVKPDARVELAVGEYEHVSFVEVDLGTEGRGALTRKCAAYLAYYRAGREQAEHGLFPRIVWITPNPARVQAIESVRRALPVDSRKLFVTAPTGAALAALAGGEDARQEGSA